MTANTVTLEFLLIGYKTEMFEEDLKRNWKKL